MSLLACMLMATAVAVPHATPDGPTHDDLVVAAVNGDLAAMKALQGSHSANELAPHLPDYEEVAVGAAAVAPTPVQAKLVNAAAIGDISSVNYLLGAHTAGELALNRRLSMPGGERNALVAAAQGSHVLVMDALMKQGANPLAHGLCHEQWKSLHGFCAEAGPCHMKDMTCRAMHAVMQTHMTAQEFKRARSSSVQGGADETSQAPKAEGVPLTQEEAIAQYKARKAASKNKKKKKPKLPAKPRRRRQGQPFPDDAPDDSASGEGSLSRNERAQQAFERRRAAKAAGGGHDRAEL